MNEKFDNTEYEEYDTGNEEIEEIASTIEPEKGSILDDETSLSALKLLKQILYEKECKLLDYKIGFDTTGFDIKGIRIKCSDPQILLDALKEIETLPGQLKPQALYDKLPNSYGISAILGELKERAKEELGLDIRAAGYQNDYVVLSFYPAEEEPAPEPMPELPPMPEEAPPEEAPPEEAAEEEEKAKEELEEIPVEEVDWDAIGL